MATDFPTIFTYQTILFLFFFRRKKLGGTVPPRKNKQISPYIYKSNIGY
jgi:hypothetical protein